MNKLVLPLAVALAACVGAAQAAGNVDAGKVKASTVCVACHGADGNSVNPIWPKLAGQNPEYLLKQLHDFKAGARTDPLMSAQGALLSDQDMDNVAAYFSQQTRSPGTAAADKVAAGQKLYRGGNATSHVAACIGCHGPAGAGNPAARYPSIAGQQADYVVKQLTDFRAGTRSNDPNQMMRTVAGKLTDAEIQAVAQYVQGLH
jgi:cytochrome c553